jgi:hypothetical protein
MDVLTTAWLAAGQPSILAASRDGTCARCGKPARLATIGKVVSKTFTAWDGWADPGGQGVCHACAWAYRAPELRRLATCVTASPRVITHPGPAAIAAALSEPLPPVVALVVPLRPGRKHLLPGARWGRVTTDDAQLSWTSADAGRLGALLRLRGSGFGSRMLARPAPDFAVLRRVLPDRRAAVLADWHELGPWRARPPWLSLALHVTVPLQDPPRAGGRTATSCR